MVCEEKQKFLPQSAHLEIARAALVHSIQRKDRAVLLEDIIWKEPIAINSDCGQVHIALFTEKPDQIDWEIYTGSERESSREAGSTGKAQSSPDLETGLLDIQKLRSLYHPSDDERMANIENVQELWVEQSAPENRTENILIRFRQLENQSSQGFKDDILLHPKLMQACLKAVKIYADKNEWQGRLASIHHMKAAVKSEPITWALIHVAMCGEDEQTRCICDVDFCNEHEHIVVSIREMYLEFEDFTDVMRQDGKRRRPEMKTLTTEQCIFLEIKNIVGKLLKIPVHELDIHASFLNMGFDSISLIEFAGVINECYEITIKPSLFFNYPTIETLSKYIYLNNKDQMEILYQQGSPEKRETKISGHNFRKQKSALSRGKKVEGKRDPIAIIGMSGRFPDASSIEEFWSILERGKEAIHPISDCRFSLWEKSRKIANKSQDEIRIGCIPGLDEFDPYFFDISPRDAELMDPRQRILLEESWKALEDAGYGSQFLEHEKIGMFVGIENGDYRTLLGEEDITSNSEAILAARISYCLNLHGPNMAINTACSSGLAAVHQACLSLRSGECDTAIAAGVNLLITPSGYHAMDKAGMLSADGHCYALDKRADGMIPGEAVAVVVLKKAVDAKRDHNPIYAAIIGSGINYDGKTNGITAPSGLAQMQLMKDVYHNFDIKPDEISYIITHGTGTKLGDPVEIDALTEVYQAYDAEKESCALTSIKPNIGHTMAASGLVSLIGLVMSMKKEIIPASINFHQLNDYLDLKDSPFYINQEKKDWKDSGKKKRLGAVNAFGMSGTNVHVVVQSDCQDKLWNVGKKPYYLLVLSAKTSKALQKKTENLLERLKSNAVRVDLSAAEYTLLAGRLHFDYRLAMVVKNVEDAVKILKQALGKEKSPRISAGIVEKDFEEDDEMVKSIGNLVNENRAAGKNADKGFKILTELAEFYCLGYDKYIQNYWKEEKPYFINLPTYPFDNERYWIPENNKFDDNQKKAEEATAVIEDERQGYTGKHQENILNKLKELVGTLMKIPNDRLDINQNLERFGFNSMSLIELEVAVNKSFDICITPEIFYAYPTLKELGQYLYENDCGKRDPAYEKKSQSRPQEDEEAQIAVIGMSGRFPNAASVKELWSILENGEESIQEITEERRELWNKFGNWKSQSEHTIRMGLIQGAGEFDPLFFDITPWEAEIMDPRQRLLLEETFKALEDAGYGNKLFQNERIGMFVGIEDGDYRMLAGEEDTLTANHNGILAARISYFLNLRGPNMAINTACSSGLVAVHQACQSLRNDECDMAIAAGVNLMVSPTGYMGMEHAGMLSPNGRCYAFDQRANGMVPSEAVAAVILKKVSKAKLDHHSIYAEIIGSGINYDGKTNGITAPNIQAQGKLFEDVYQRFCIDPQDISYIVTHGTGTKLGDPIEVNALVDTFKKYTQKEKICALTSIKPNLGHSLAASGVVSLISLVMSLKQQMIPASIHYERRNDFLRLDHSPFYINQENKEWVDIEGKQRLGAVNSFGMSGTNAHVVVKSNHPETSEKIEKPYYLLAFSAKTEAALQRKIEEMAERLKEYVKTGNTDLSAVSYTLLEGRMHFVHRLAVVAENMASAVRILKLYGTKDEIAGVVKGKVPKDFIVNRSTQDMVENLATGLSGMCSDEEYGQILNQLAQFYCLGYENCLEDLWGEKKPYRVSLPAYPFSKDVYWVENKRAEMNREVNCFYPLLHQNISDITGLNYSFVFDGNEFFFEDHIIKGKKVLPGVVYLEMVFEAVMRALDGDKRSSIAMSMKNITWIQPVVMDQQPVRINIALEFRNADEVTFEMYKQDDKNKESLLSQGKVLLYLEEGPVVRDLEKFKGECHKVIGSDQCYEAFHRLKINYGNSFKGVEKMWVGRNEILTRINLPEAAQSNFSQYALHPVIMDSVLQSIIGFQIAESVMEAFDEKNPSIPFEMEEVRIYKPCAMSGWAILKRVNEDNNLNQFDIDLCDEQGNVNVHIKKYTPIEVKTKADEVDTDDVSMYLLHGEWEERARTESKTNYMSKLMIFCDLEHTMKEIMDKGDWTCNKARCINVNRKDCEKGHPYETYVCAVLEQIQEVFKTKERTLVQVITPGREEWEFYSGILGLLKSAELENPLITTQLIELKEAADAEEIKKLLLLESSNLTEKYISFQNGKRFIYRWKQLENSKKDDLPWKEKGTYLITGGAGGLGLIFAREIAKKTKDAKIILAGRSPENGRIRTSLEEIRLLGANVQYHEMDVTDEASVTDAIQEIIKSYHSLDGIIHAAGIIKDGYIISKNKIDVKEVLAPKVTGVINLDRATKDIPLDFLVFFSSSAGSMGNAGQSDYAAANAFMNDYAEYRNGLQKIGKRHGKSLSINWPLWQEGGMTIDAEIRKIVEKTTGLISLPTDVGIRAFYECFDSGCSQITCLFGVLKNEIMRSILQEAAIMESNDEKEGKDAERKVDHIKYKEKTDYFLKQILSGVLKFPVQYIETDVQWNEYGIDSILIIKLTNELEKTFGVLSKTLFFEYETIGQLSSYFMENHHEKLRDMLGIKDIKNKEASPRKHEAPYIKMSMAEKNQENHSETDIAIVGLSGKYPKSEDCETFWEKISNGENCITEVPKDRWNHDIYYDEDKNRAGKTYSKWGGFIDGVEQFDPMFFHISPKEAQVMDPQERLFLQCVYETMEDAGYTGENLLGDNEAGAEKSVGVYVGVAYEEYQLYGAQEQSKGNMQTFNGSSASIANRVSYFFDFQGPSFSLNTMCSSSLYAIHLACQGLRLGECKAAIAGGVNLSIHPNKYLILSRDKFLSEKGQCTAFGEGGDGYVPSEGVGAVLLKPLARAIEAGDHIYGVIKGSAVNHGGKTNGYSVPKPEAQCRVIQKVLEEARINPRTISYVEAHGTGTSLGDPIEIAGLTKAFQKYSKDTGYCAIGSVKSNVGHCESAAGIAGLTKVLMQMKYGKIAPSLYAKTLNPFIKFEETPFLVQQELKEWVRPVMEENGLTKEYPRRAGLSSFGAGGSNAHMIIEEYQEQNMQQTEDKKEQDSVIILLSAKNKEQLKMRAKKLYEVIERGAYCESDLCRIAYTLQVGRESMPNRLGMIVSGLKQLEEGLEHFIQDQESGNSVYYGEVKHNNEIFSIIEGDKDVLIKKWINNEAFDKLVKLWVNGLSVDWNRLYDHAGRHPRKISLPTYPFAKERYWVEQAEPICPDLEKRKEDKVVENTAQKLESKDVWNEVKPESVARTVEQFVMDEIHVAISQLLHIPPEKIDMDENFENFGFDSISLVEFAGVLNEHFALAITPDLFFSYPTSAKLTSHLVEKYQEELKHYCPKQEDAVLPEEKKEQLGQDESDSTQMSPKEDENGEEPIAIIGMSGRFPEAGNIEELWSILEEGRQVIQKVPKERRELWNAFGRWEDKAQGSLKMGLIPGIAEFDPEFFEISPREAIMMDPRQRILLEEAYKALEDAGYGKKELSGEKIGIFVGAEDGDYRQLVEEEGTITSNHNGIMAARLAYFLDLKGPNMTINTACSSGLMAVHQAVLSLRSKECDTAIVAGANLLIAPSGYAAMDKAGMLSPDGVCYAFDQRANGMVPAEAVAVIILKRSVKAEADGNQIYAEIIGSGSNYDGRTNGITAPSGYAQTQLLKDIYDRYHINPREIGYIVTHGTGTKLGDPIEINALAEAFREYTDEAGSCALTSIKANIGHTLAASGVVSLISLVMAMKKELIPPSINCGHINNYIHWEKSPFYINAKKKEWKDMAGKSRYGGVSAFGFSGTNVHVVLRSYHSANMVNENPYYLFVFSAKSSDALESTIQNLLNKLETDKTMDRHDLIRISYTLLEGRQHFNNRLAFVAKDKVEVIEILKKLVNHENVVPVWKGKVPRNFKAIKQIQNLLDDLISQSLKEKEHALEYKNILYKLAENYCLGYAEFSGIFEKFKPVPISLPSYPFAGKTFWANKQINVMSGKEPTQGPKITLDELHPVPENQSRIPSEDLRPGQIQIANCAQEEIQKGNKGVSEWMNELSASLAEVLFLNIAEIDTEKSFVDQGLDSIIGIEWIRHINKKYGLAISTTAIYQYPNLHDFAVYLAGKAEPDKIGNNKFDILLKELSVSLSEQLFIPGEEIDLEKSFMEQGLDSIVGVEWIRGINKKYGTAIPTTKMYQYPNLYGFTSYLVGELDQDEKRKHKETKLLTADHVKIGEIMNELAASLSEQLFIPKEEIDPEKNFMELGLDSIIGVEWIRALNKKYGVNVSSTKMYQYPNLFEFAEYLDSQLKHSEPQKEENKMNELLWQVYQGEVGVNDAKSLFYQNAKEGMGLEVR